MPIDIVEKFGSGQSNRAETASQGSDSIKRYIATGSDDEADIKDAIATAAPTTVEGLARRTIRADPVGDGIWEVEVGYSDSNRGKLPAPGESTFTFDTGGGTQHITQSIATVNAYARPDFTAPDFKGAIGVTKDGVEGADITVPVYQFSETHFFADADVDTAYKVALYAATGKTNAGTFRGFAIGEVLFLGATGTRRGSRSVDPWEITFKFAVSPNVTGLTIGEITGIDKKGWEYLWIRYADVEDTIAKTVVARPESVHIEQVYLSANFATLGI